VGLLNHLFIHSLEFLMRISHVTPILVKRYLNENTRKRTTFLRGPSGIGKSEIVFQTSKLLGEHVTNWHGVVDLRLAQMDPTDLRGIPHVREGRTCWARPDFLVICGLDTLSDTMSAWSLMVMLFPCVELIPWD